LALPTQRCTFFNTICINLSNPFKSIKSVINTGEKAFDYWKRKKVHPYSPHWEKPFETLQKLRI